MPSHEPPPSTAYGVSESTFAAIVDLMEALTLVGDQLSAVADEFHRSRGLHGTDSAALHLLSRRAMAMGELASGLRLTPAATTSVVDRLESAGLAERQPDPQDRRRTVVSATPLADPEAEELHLRVFEALAGVPPGDLTRFTAIVASLHDALDARQP